MRRSSRTYLALRRGLDIVTALVALTIFAALLPLIALAIRIDSPGSIFYSQSRVGMNRRRDERRRVQRGEANGDRRKVIYPGRPFRIFKLRSMRSDAERDGPQLAGANDGRITRVGAILRKTRLDEVPQFWNVLKGDMSLIGPRPERLHFIHQYETLIPGYIRRLDVLPGITGLAQVRNGYDEDLTSVKRKVALDRCYMRRSGFLVDLRIIFSTVRVVLTGHGAR
jgi:lipopolysaccharide/colanic/teichoic acid biosynthesis glycosyltransferase